jgi:hypothetical protein
MYRKSHVSQPLGMKRFGERRRRSAARGVGPPDRKSEGLEKGHYMLRSRFHLLQKEEVTSLR